MVVTQVRSVLALALILASAASECVAVPVREVTGGKDKVNPPGKVVPTETDKGIFEMATLQMRIPVRVGDNERAKVLELRLVCSSDHGKSWTVVAKTTPDELASFVFHAPSDGIYWLTTQIVRTDGTLEPADFTRLRPTLKIRVDTSKNR